MATASKNPQASTAAAVPGAEPQYLGYLVEFENPTALVHAAEKVRDSGYKNWDAHCPFPVHGLDHAMGLREPILPWIVLGAGLTGLGLALLMQWWMNAYDYPLIVSGKPFWSIPANIPVMFEMTVLFSGITLFFGMLFFNRLPQYYHPVFHSERFKRATTDRFFISLLADDPKFNREKARQLAESLHGSNVEVLEG
ncbi:DUF3341 domain-containing protein [bacterium]|nr:DUF3341 domain-containing protein [bacterium]